MSKRYFLVFYGGIPPIDQVHVEIFVAKISHDADIMVKVQNIRSVYDVGDKQDYVFVILIFPIVTTVSNQFEIEFFILVYQLKRSLANLKAWKILFSNAKKFASYFWKKIYPHLIFTESLYLFNPLQSGQFRIADSIKKTGLAGRSALDPILLGRI
jgi:hypothetical protein